MRAGFEESDNRLHWAMIVGGFGQVQFAQNASHVLLDGTFGKPQPTGDACVGAPLGHQRQNLMLSRTENGKRIFASTRGHQLLGERRIDHRDAIGDPVWRIDELCNICRPTLEEVTDPMPACYELYRILDFVMRRQNEYAGFGQLLPDYSCDVKAFGGVGRRHTDVDDKQVGCLRAGAAPLHPPVLPKPTVALKRSGPSLSELPLNMNDRTTKLGPRVVGSTLLCEDTQPL